MVTNYDFMPTLLSHMGLGERMPTKPRSPGRDFSDVLTSSAAGQSLPAPADPPPCFMNLKACAAFAPIVGSTCIDTPTDRTNCTTWIERPGRIPQPVSDNDGSTPRLAHKLKQRLRRIFQHEIRFEPRIRSSTTAAVRRRVIYDSIPMKKSLSAEPVDPPKHGRTGFSRSTIHAAGRFFRGTRGRTATRQSSHNGHVSMIADGLFVCDGRGREYVGGQNSNSTCPTRIQIARRCQDGDGSFDKSTVFADNMTFPMGGAWHDGALYVASPPNIWRLEDTDGDGSGRPARHHRGQIRLHRQRGQHSRVFLQSRTGGCTGATAIMVTNSKMTPAMSSASRKGSYHL